MVMAGVCSAYHHATDGDHTLIIDWFPISISIALCLWWGILWQASGAALTLCTLSMCWLFVDHLGPVIPLPWGHVIWHILAATSTDALYMSVLYQ